MQRIVVYSHYQTRGYSSETFKTVEMKTLDEIPATIANLKSNRDLIIEALKKVSPEEKLIIAMGMLKDSCECSRGTMQDEINTIEDVFKKSNMKRSTADTLAGLAESRGEYWDSKTQSYKKY